MSFLRKLKGSKHILKKGDTFLNNIEETAYFDLNQRDLIVYHIDSETEGTFSLTVKNDDLGDTVLDKVCDHYNLHDYKEYFGLKYTLVDHTGDHEILWLDSTKAIGRQLKDTNNVLTFRIKHFPGKPQNIESEYVRYLIFLQIRNYLLKGDLQLALTEDIKLAAFAVQACLGDYDPLVHQGNYLADIKFLSRKSFKAEEKIMELHKQLVGKTPAEMELAFLEKASEFDTYGAELIVVKTSKGVPINFGVSHNGIITYLHGTPANIAKIDMFPWNQIGKISYEHRTLRVHFHTPDRENSEIIKKQVMIFKCNNSRVCKHLWKFVLDQKAFFNFKRGVDVPKIKSSSRLFSLKSKFRFSGRCERELISAQSMYDRSLSSVDSTQTLSNLGDTTTSTAFNSLNRSGYTDSSSNTMTDGRFIRRTFLPTPRSFVRPKHDTKSVIKSDSNNNELSNSTAHSIDNINQETKSPLNKQLSIVSEKDSVPSSDQPTELNNNEIETVNEQNNLGIAPVHATSTPHLIHKTSNANFEATDKRLSAIPVMTDLSEQKLNQASQLAEDSNKNKKTSTLDDESEDEFFEHDDYNRTQHRTNELVTRNESTTDNLSGGDYDKQNGMRKDQFVFTSDKDHLSADGKVNTSTSKQPRSLTHNLSCSLLIVVSIMFIFFFFLILIQHWKCTLIDHSIIKSKTAPNCNYQKTVSKLTDNLNFGFKTVFSQISSSSGLLDFLPSWFFNQSGEEI